MQGREFELKFTASAAELRKVADHPLFAGTAPAPPVRLTATYFDTPDRALHAAGISLRVRDEGSRQTQTLKRVTSSAVDREEWEAEADGPAPSLDWIAGTPLKRAFRHGVGERLAAVFTVEVERQTFALDRGGAAIEVAVDRGEIRAGASTTPVAEVELELKGGEAGALFGLARELVGEVALLPSLLGKAERGFRLLGADARVPAPAPDGPVADGFEGIAQACLRDLLAQLGEIGTGDDVEAVHRARVALRRLRAALTLFKPALGDAEVAPVRGELKWMSDLLGAARDRDVLQTAVFDPAARSPALLGGFELAAHMQERRAEAHAALAAGLASRRWREGLVDLLAWITAGDWRAGEAAGEPLAGFVRPRLRKARKRVVREGAGLEEASPHARHRLRIRAKTLRYGLGFFADTPGLGKGSKPYAALLDGLQTLQGALGHLHDHDALGDLLHTETFTWPGAADGEAHGHAQFAAGLLAGSAPDTHALVDEAARTVRKLRRHDPF